jgi:CheY-like chemotaxis protein
MDEATLARAQEPFFTTKGVGKGTGLGLSMVQGLAAQSGGRLVLRSLKGEGTTAEVWLPVADYATITSIKDAEDYKPTPAIHALTVLVVDDDPLVLANTAAMLDDLGHTAGEASSGLQALDLLRAGRTFDLVITDQAMSGMTGVQLAREIQEEWPNLPVLLATGYADVPPGPDANLIRLSKPFGQDALARAIAECLNRHTDTAKVLPFRLKKC